MFTIPIADVYSQKFTSNLAGQNCQIELYQKGERLYCNLFVSDALIIGGVVCENLNRIVRDTYLGFLGDLIFNDTQGTDDPKVPGLGTRYLLFYLEASDLGDLG